MRRLAPLLALTLLARPAAARETKAVAPLLALIETVEANYAGDPAATHDDLLKSAMGGMVASLDRYSEFLDQQKYKDLQEDTKGSFGGIGIEIGFVSGRLSVIAPIEGTPADKAGLLGGDIIAFINGTPTDDMKIMDAVHRIKGPPGTRVTITIQRESVPMKDYVLVRGLITPVNIRDTVVDGMGYVTIRSFSEHTADLLAEALDGFTKSGCTGVILDLRSNPGGLLNEASHVVDLFLPFGSPIVSTEGRDPQQRVQYFARNKEPFHLPVVVLTNEHSASGSEIVAGALKDTGRAVVMGRRTFGKGSVQNITPISHDRMLAVRLTIAKYYTPRHNEIHEVGIEPDVTLPPVRYPSGLRKFQEEGSFNRFALEALPQAAGGGTPGATAWLDGRAFAEGRLVGSARDTDSLKVDTRLGAEFRRWAESKGLIVTDEVWEDERSVVVEQVRIAQMRKVKGEEGARKFAVEFDPQVKAAVALLKLAVRGAPGSALKPAGHAAAPAP